MNYTAVILAGGKSVRFGKDKTLLKINNELIIENIVRKCKAIFSEILLVSNERNKFGIKGVREISDIHAGHGPLGGIHAGLTEAKNKICFVLACDMPFFSASLAEHLLAEAEGFDAVVPRELTGHPQPLFAVYNKSCLVWIEKLIFENRNSVLNLCEIARVKYIDEPQWKEITNGNKDVFFNINYAADYRRAISEKYGGGTIGLEAAVGLLIKNTAPITDTRTVSLMDGCGQVSSADIVSTFDNPPFNRSPLDGYALCSKDSIGANEDNPVRLKVVSEVYAGGSFNGKTARGQAVRIMTGAPIPEGCDCVIRQEDTDYGADEVEIYRELEKHQNFCYQGEDVRRGQMLVRKGDTLTSAHLGILSGMGIANIKITRPARVGLMCTGDELVPIGSPLTHGKIYDSNLYMLSGRLIGLGIDVASYPPAADDASEVAAQIASISEQTDVIITTGGVSVGKKDIMHEVFSLLDVNRLFWRVGFKPGTPVLSGMYKNKPILCLSGNPFAAASTFELLVRPVLAALTGKEGLMYKRTKARLMNDFKKSSPERRFIRARLENGEVFLNNGSHSSGALFSMLGCNAFIDIPAGSPALRGGMIVDTVVL